MTLNIIRQHLQLRLVRRPEWQRTGRLPPHRHSLGELSGGDQLATYEWFRNGESIAAATGETYNPVAGDLDEGIHAVVTAHRAAYADNSDATEAITIVPWKHGVDRLPRGRR